MTVLKFQRYSKVSSNHIKLVMQNRSSNSCNKFSAVSALLHCNETGSVPHAVCWNSYKFSFGYDIA